MPNAPVTPVTAKKHKLSAAALCIQLCSLLCLSLTPIKVKKAVIGVIPVTKAEIKEEGKK